jgi:hypothetical protein
MKTSVFLLELIIILANSYVKCEITYIEVQYPLRVRYEQYLHKFSLSVSHLR